MTIVIHVKDGQPMAAGWIAEHLGLSRRAIPVDGPDRDAWLNGAALREQTAENEPPGGWGQVQITIVQDRR